MRPKKSTCLLEVFVVAHGLLYINTTAKVTIKVVPYLASPAISVIIYSSTFNCGVEPELCWILYRMLLMRTFDTFAQPKLLRSS